MLPGAMLPRAMLPGATLPKETLRGLSETQVREARRRYGSNSLPEKKEKGFFKRLLSNLSDPIIRILIGALAVNLLLTWRNINWAESIGIVLSILIAAVVSTVSECGSERAFERLRAENAKQTATVLRDGKRRTVPGDEIVVGDLLYITAGEMLLCDGTLAEGSLRVDQSALNGETAEVKKDPGDPLLRGSLVCGGEGYLRAEKIGRETVYGKIAEEIQTETRISPLKLRLEKLASSVAHLGYFAAFLVSFTYLLNVFVIDSGFSAELIYARLTDLHFVAESVIKAVTIAVTVLVVAVPEGLPMMITVVLSSNMKRMLRDGVLVRKLVGIETAGSMNLLFTDKTGTVTTGKLRVERLIGPDGMRLDGSLGAVSPGKELLACMTLGSPCVFEDGADGAAGAVKGGNATDRAFAEFAAAAGAFPEKAARTVPFSSEKKFSAAWTPGAVGEGSKESGISFYKGAPEYLFPLCKSCLSEGVVIPFKQKMAVAKEIRRAAEESCRVVLLAMRKGEPTGDTLPRDLIFLAAAVIRDKVRPSAKKTVSQLRAAGIATVMITGDSPETAAAVARESGILHAGRDLVLTGDELGRYSDYELRAALPHLAVVARALPQDKTRLVRVSQEAGMVTGMTGDGVNDAPALKLADIGFSMGGGTEIAKEAGDIVLLKEDLSTIALASLYGRTIFRSIRKFIVFQLTMNLCAVGVSLLGQLMGIDSPVTVVQMLWINLIMDTLGGLAFAGEPPLASYMKEPPKKREERILTSSMLRQVVCMGGFVAAICSFFLFSEKVRMFYGFYENPLYLLTAYFALFIFAGILVCFTSRSERVNLLSHLSKNKPFMVIMAAVTAVQLLMLYFGGSVFRCTPLSPKELLLALLFAVTVLPADFLRRMAGKLLRLKKKRKNEKMRKKCKYPIAIPKKMEYNQDMANNAEKCET